MFYFMTQSTHFISVLQHGAHNSSDLLWHVTLTKLSQLLCFKYIESKPFI